MNSLEVSSPTSSTLKGGDVVSHPLDYLSVCITSVLDDLVVSQLGVINVRFGLVKNSLGLRHCLDGSFENSNIQKKLP